MSFPSCWKFYDFLSTESFFVFVLYFRQFLFLFILVVKITRLISELWSCSVNLYWTIMIRISYWCMKKKSAHPARSLLAEINNWTCQFWWSEWVYTVPIHFTRRPFLIKYLFYFATISLVLTEPFLLYFMKHTTLIHYTFLERHQEQ